MSQEKLDLFAMREAYRTDNPKHPASWLVYVWSYKEKKRQRASMWHYEERGQPLFPPRGLARDSIKQITKKLFLTEENTNIFRFMGKQERRASIPP